MSYDVELKIEDDYVIARAFGPSSLENNIEFCKSLIEICLRSGKEKVAVDVRGVTEGSDLIDLYKLAKEISIMVKGDIKRCALIQRELGEIETFTENAMRNRGLDLRTFHEDESALSWLVEGE